jgi:hypothetical protein
LSRGAVKAMVLQAFVHRFQGMDCNYAMYSLHIHLIYAELQIRLPGHCSWQRKTLRKILFVGNVRELGISAVAL